MTCWFDSGRRLFQVELGKARSEHNESGHFRKRKSQRALSPSESSHNRHVSRSLSGHDSNSL
jgi:hypothetical protein